MAEKDKKKKKKAPKPKKKGWMPDPLSRKDLIREIKDCMKKENFIFTNHATKRLRERIISQFDVEDILRGTFTYEDDKKEFNAEHSAWNYPVFGKNPDRENIRIVISFDASKKMLVITTMKLKK